MAVHTSPTRDMDTDLHTYISGKLLEGVEHVEAVEVNYSSSQGVIVPAATGVKKTDRGTVLIDQSV